MQNNFESSSIFPSDSHSSNVAFSLVSLICSSIKTDFFWMIVLILWIMATVVYSLLQTKLLECFVVLLLIQQLLISKCFHLMVWIIKTIFQVHFPTILLQIGLTMFSSQEIFLAILLILEVLMIFIRILQKPLILFTFPILGQVIVCLWEIPPSPLPYSNDLSDRIIPPCPPILHVFSFISY